MGPSRESRAVTQSKIAVLLRQLDSPDQQASFEAAREIVNIQSRAATRGLIAVAAKAAETHCRCFAIFALRQLKDRRALNSLIECTRFDRAPEVRDEAVEALGWFLSKKHPRALKAVLNAGTDQAPSVRWTAAFVLRFCDSPAALHLLNKMTLDTDAPTGRSDIATVAKETLTLLGRAQV